MKVKKNRIGLDAKKAKELSVQLNELLASYQIFYQNVRGFHWNIKGDNFFELHLKFEELYTDALLKVDEIAERVLTLGHTPKHTFTDYIKSSKIEAYKDVSDGKDAITKILVSLQVLLEKEREILKFSSSANDEGTNALMSDYISQQEKLVWMYSAFNN